MSLSSQPIGYEIVRVENVTSGLLVADSVQVAGNSALRRKGLLHHTSLGPQQGLWIVPCESVHTIGMKFPIDLVYLDSKYRVRKLRSDVPAWRISMCLSAHSILELSAGTIERTGLKVGDQLQILRQEAEDAFL